MSSQLKKLRSALEPCSAPSRKYLTTRIRKLKVYAALRFAERKDGGGG
ncbi:MAG: hypothetical protein ABW099_04235 [Candidatus Binatia bacterium]|jgi:hypothetical protein